MITLEQAGNLINGLYLAIKVNDYDLLSKTVNELEGKFTNPFFRAYISYRYLKVDYVYMCLKLSAKFLNDYYGKSPCEDGPEEDLFFEEVVNEANNIIQIVRREDDDSDLRNYISCIMAQCMSIIEAESKERKKNIKNVTD